MVSRRGRQRRHGKAIGLGFLLILSLGDAPVTAQIGGLQFGGLQIGASQNGGSSNTGSSNTGPQTTGQQTTGLQDFQIPTGRSVASNFVVSATVQDSCSISGNDAAYTLVHCRGNTPMEAVYSGRGGRGDLRTAKLNAGQSGRISLARQTQFCGPADQDGFSGTGTNAAYATVEACF